MSSFTLTTLTTKGIDVLARLVAGSTMEFTAIKVGDGALGSNNPQTLTALVHVVDTLNINACEVTSAGVARVQATFTNQGKTAGFFYREIGLFCKDPVTKKEVLFAYGNAGDAAEWIPQAGEGTVIEKIVNLETVIGNASKVTASLVSGIYATTDQLNAEIAKLATKTELTSGLALKANDNAVVHISGTETVSGAKTFSAKITASGGVQGNVTGNLTGTASKATADATGRNIVDTYATKAENNLKANTVDVVRIAGMQEITGQKTFTNDVFLSSSDINRSDNAGELRINGGKAPGSGASLFVYGFDHPNSPGKFILRAYNNSGISDFIGRPDGSLLWGGNNVLTTKNGLQLSGGTMTGGITMQAGTISADKSKIDQLALHGDKNGQGAYVSLCNEKHAENPGGFSLSAYNGTKRYSLWGTTAGELTWGGDAVITAASAQTITGPKTFTNTTMIKTFNFTGGVVGNTADNGANHFCGGTTLGKGALLVLYGYEHTSKGNFLVRADKGDGTYCDLVGTAPGGISWGGKSLLSAMTAGKEGYFRDEYSGFTMQWGQCKTTDTVNFTKYFSTISGVIIQLKDATISEPRSVTVTKYTSTYFTCKGARQSSSTAIAYDTGDVFWVAYGIINP